MTVKEYLSFVMELKKVPKKERRDQLAMILKMAMLGEYEDRMIRNLSKGYKQRVGIAQALVGNPSILILDEPTVGLDPNQIIEIRRLIKALSKNHSIVISSHILSEIQEIADRVVIINRGKIAAVDTISDLSKRLSGQSKILLTFRGPVTDAVTKIRTVKGVSSAVSRVANKFSQIEITISANDTSETRIAIFNLMVREGWPILELRSLDPSLEEIFLNITSGKGGVKS
jgi:ABC-2 type transport system ATP-binding protein